MRYHLIILHSWWNAAKVAFSREINRSVMSVRAIGLQHAGIHQSWAKRNQTTFARHKLRSKPIAPAHPTMENYPMSWMARLGKHHARRRGKRVRDNSAAFYDPGIIFFRFRLNPLLWLGSAAFPLRWRKGQRRFMNRGESIIYVATWLLRLGCLRLSFDLSYLSMNSGISLSAVFHARFRVSLYRASTTSEQRR